MATQSSAQFAKKFLSLCFVAVALIACDDDREIKKMKSIAAENDKQGKTVRFDIKVIASAADNFVRSNNGCIPLSPTDLFSKPTDARFTELGCKSHGTQNSDFSDISADFQKRLKDYSFVRRWDGQLVIEFRLKRKDLMTGQEDGRISQCSFLDVENDKCIQ